MTRTPMPGFDVEGPVQAEVFVLFLDGGRPSLTGPCGAAPWYLEVDADEDPMAVVVRAVRRVLGTPLVVHSTSWRRDRDAVVLSFVAVIDAALVGDLASAAVDRTELARGGAAASPAAIATGQIIEHGLRHLAWLVRDDPAVAERLAVQWRAALEGYVPEPFRHLKAARYLGA
jgi:hypothetical protein